MFNRGLPLRGGTPPFWAVGGFNLGAWLEIKHGGCCYQVMPAYGVGLFLWQIINFADRTGLSFSFLPAWKWREAVPRFYSCMVPVWGKSTTGHMEHTPPGGIMRVENTELTRSGQASKLLSVFSKKYEPQKRHTSLKETHTEILLVHTPCSYPLFILLVHTPCLHLLVSKQRPSRAIYPRAGTYKLDGFAWCEAESSRPFNQFTSESAKKRSIFRGIWRLVPQAANFGRYSSHWHHLSPHRTVDVVDVAGCPKIPAKMGHPAHSTREVIEPVFPFGNQEAGRINLCSGTATGQKSKPSGDVSLSFMIYLPLVRCLPFLLLFDFYVLLLAES